MDNKKIIEYLESKGLNLSLEMPEIKSLIEEMEITKKNIELAKKDILEQVEIFFDDNDNYRMFQKDFEDSNLDFTGIVEIADIVNEYLEKQVKEWLEEITEDFFVIKKVDPDGSKYKALNMEELEDCLPAMEKHFNFIKNMSKEEILEFMHYEEHINQVAEREVYAFFPNEILEYMNPEYIKDDEFVKKILGAFIVEYPYNEVHGNVYYRLVNDEFPISNINSNYRNFFNRLTPEQQTKFSSIVGTIEPALTDIKDWYPYAVVEYLWDNGRYCEILKHIEDEENIERKETLQANFRRFIEDLMYEVEAIIDEGEDIKWEIDSEKFKFLSKLYTTEFGRAIIDDEKWSQILKEDKELLDERMQKEAELKSLQAEDEKCDETLEKIEQLGQIQENGNKTAVDD